MKECQNLFDVYTLYSQHVKDIYPSYKAKKILNETQSAVLRFLILGLGYEKQPTGTKMTQRDIQAAYEFLKTISLDSLVSLNEAIEKGFEIAKASLASRNTYGSRFKQLLAWAEQQHWWSKKDDNSIKERNRYCPRMRKGNGRAKTKKLTDRQDRYSAYQLKPKEISKTLQAELTNMYEYLTTPECPGRLHQAITVSSAKTYQKHLLLILGWLHRYQNVPIENLSLNLLVPKITDEDLEKLTDSDKAKLWKQKQLQIDNLICNYFDFLRKSMEAFSPNTKKFKINALSALAKFQYHTEVVHLQDYNTIPVIKVINKHSRNIRKQIKQWESQKRATVKPIDKWPQVIDTKTALSSVRLQILEPLRLECRIKYDNWHLRDNTAIAMSIERYLVWSFLADMPARRQEEYRSLRIALSCPINRPTDIPENGIYQPLPPIEVREKHYDNSLADNYIYKTYVYKDTYYKSGLWILDIQNYKTRKAYGSQSIVIPNRKFNDGNYLYDYIERYLYGWINEDNSQHRKWLTTGRISFNPNDACYIYNQSKTAQFWSWGYFFIQPLNGTAYNSSSFKESVRTAAHRLTGVPITPHIMRSVWATWSYQIGLTDAERESLAYAMGHDIETMLELYEKCTPDEKRRPIEEFIDEELFSTFKSITRPEEKLTQSVSKSKDYLEKIAQNLLELPNQQLEQIVQLLKQ